MKVKMKPNKFKKIICKQNTKINCQHKTLIFFLKYRSPIRLPLLKDKTIN